MLRAHMADHADAVALPPTDRVSWSGPASFVALTFALSWSIWIGTWLACGQPASIRNPAMMIAIYAGTFAPGLAGALLSLRQGPGALAVWAKSFVLFRCNWRAYAAATLPLPLAMLALTFLLGYHPRSGSAPGHGDLAFYLTLFPVSIFNGVATAIMGAGPLGEEGGWRGYLLPALLRRVGHARAPALLGVIWALWHLPVMALFPEWRDGTTLGFYLPVYGVGVVGLSYALAAVWRLGRGSLVPCIWMHGLVNALGGTAFVHALWNSRWSQQASELHSAAGFWIVALLLLAWTSRRGGEVADPRRVTAQAAAWPATRRG